MKNIIAGYKGLMLAIFGGDLENIFPLGKGDFRKIDDVLKTLTPMEQEVIKLRFGLDGEPQILRKIGERFGVTGNRIRQVEAKTLRRLRIPVRLDMLKFYLRSHLEDEFRDIREKLLVLTDEVNELKTELFSLKTGNIAPAPSSGILNTPLDQFDISVRAANCLINSRIKTIGELAVKTEDEMLKIRNIGRKSLGELRSVLAQYGLSFGMKLNN